MSTIKLGSVTVQLPEEIVVPTEAGHLSPAEVRRLPRARHGIGLAAEMTAAVLTKHPELIPSPGITPEELAAKGRAAENMDVVISEMEATLVTLKQTNLIVDADAHNALRRALASVRAAEKFDPMVSNLFPHLIRYFANEMHPQPAAEDTTTP